MYVEYVHQYLSLTRFSQLYYTNWSLDSQWQLYLQWDLT